MQEFARHLRRQYDDRVVYWKSRSDSRLRAPLSTGWRTYCVIIDGLDHNKFRLPRSQIFSSKEFSAVPRPVMDCTGIIIHGVAAYAILSEMMTPKDNSWHVELLYHVLHRLCQQGHDMRQAELILQTDNTSRECKNSTMLRSLALAVGLHRLKRAEYRNLMAAHSHEDIDQWFSMITADLEASPELHVPADFVDLLNRHLAKSSNRPYEVDDREAFLHDTVRDWNPACVRMTPTNAHKLRVFFGCWTKLLFWAKHAF